MKELIPSYFHINIPFFIILILAIIAGVYTYFYYRKTVPPVSEKIKIFLGILRGTATFLILSLLFSPQLKLVWQNETNPEIIIAIDKSASMQITDDKEQRFDIANTISEFITDKLINTNDIHTYYFDVDTITKTDSVIAGKLGTNIDFALNNISKKHKDVESIILISDGIITEGSNPLFSNNIKKNTIHTIGIGDTTETPDVLIKNINANKTVYKNNPTTISAEITTKNLKDFETTAKLLYNNKIIAAKKVKINQSNEIYQIDFEIIPDKIGNIKYEVQIAGFESEKFKENNTYQFQLEVLKDKLKIGLLADKPGYDVKFIKQILKSEKSFILSSFIKIKPNFYEVPLIHKIIDSSDVLLLFDFPGKNAPSSLINYLINMIDKKRIPICYFVSSQSNRYSYQLLNKRFPEISYGTNKQFINVFAVPTIAGRLNNVFNIFDSSELNESFWQNCSPIEYYFNNIKMSKTDKVLLQTNDQSQMPVLLTNTYQGIHNLLFLGNGFWRWKFLSAEDKQFATAYETFIINLIKWISKNPGSKNINIDVNKKALPLGEELIANIQLYDAAFNPITDGEIKIQISGPSGDFEAITKNTGNGIYTWQYTPFVEGSYQIKADAYKNDVFLGDNEIEINVLPVNNEFIYTRQDADFLNKLALSTNGKYFTADNYRDIVPLIPKTPRTNTLTVNYDLWNKLYSLLLIIFLLSVEWFIRKRKGLA
ncbi:MAG: hypothetical protein KAS18_07815 [Calditrichia bacterium]|nr:hypothetical protein [Calditrichia bacterium]